jgi:outer membrane protein OmpA-like peptidoglycan-associated protein
MKRSLLVMLCICSLTLCAQNSLPVFIAEDFKVTPNWQWIDVDNENVYRKVRDGHLYVNQKAENVFWTLSDARPNSKKDFRIEMKFRAVEPMLQGRQYIVLHSHNSLYLYFGINPELQNYYIGFYKDEWKTYHTLDAPLQMINQGLAYNTIAVSLVGSTISFEINGETVNSYSFKEKFPDFFDGIAKMGVATENKVVTETDYFNLYQKHQINLLTKEIFGLQKISLGDSVNTSFIEKNPIISADGKSIYFVRTEDPSSPFFKEGMDDIFLTTAINDTTWRKAIPLPSPVNNLSNNSVLSVTPDNNSLFLMHTYNDDGSFKAPGFSISERTSSGWSLPKDVKMVNYFNRGKYNEFYLSSDRKVMILGVDRPDTQGDNDLYVSFLQDNGEFSEPKNMGAVINTSAWEGTPFLAADDKTLYFGSEGHDGYGSSDIFVSKRLDDTWLNWSKPQNLGPEINSSSWEAYFSVPASGKYGYIVSSAKGSSDIYRIKLPAIFKPEPVVVVSGKVINSKTKQPVDATILFSDLKSDNDASKATTDPVSNQYTIALPSGKVYAFLAQKDGYYATSENLDLTALKNYEEIKKDLYITPIEVGQTIRLNNIFFDFNKAELKQESYQELARVIQLLNENKSLQIEVSGHTDNVGDDAYNVRLSQQRSDAVANYLKENGFSDRVKSKGYGKSKPIVSNDNDKNRAINRRVEFTILVK